MSEEQTIWDNLKWNDGGLIPVVAQQYDSGEVLMLAWMSRAALEETLASGQMCYYSRSREGLWRKGERSGQTQTLKELRLDCDGDALLALIDQHGVACHTGRRRCFFRKLEGEKLSVNENPLQDPKELYKE